MVKKISEILKELVVGILIFGLIAQIIGAFVVETQWIYALGLWVGVITAIIMAYHMERSISLALDLGDGDAQKYVQKNSTIRYAGVIIIFIAVGLINKHSVVPCFMGVMGLKVAAYLQPFTHKIILKVRGRRDSD